ncbi:hypothetical protein BDV12DRAFT_204183 [Aspergillus spectabilis]
MSLSKALPPSAISTSLSENDLNLLFYLLKTPYFTGKETIAVTALIFPKLEHVRTFILDQLSETKKTFLEFHAMNILKEDERKTITGMAHVRLDSIRYKLHAEGVYTNCSASAQKMLHTLSVYLARFNDCPERWPKERFRVCEEGIKSERSALISGLDSWVAAMLQLCRRFGTALAGLLCQQEGINSYLERAVHTMWLLREDQQLRAGRMQPVSGCSSRYSLAACSMSKELARGILQRILKERQGYIMEYGRALNQGL